jgi:hypothetical protein
MQVLSKLLSFAISLVIAIVSLGWLVPLYLSVYSYLQGFENLLRGTERNSSFPYFSFGFSMLRMAAFWGGISLLAWTSIAINRIFAKNKPSQQIGD